MATSSSLLLNHRQLSRRTAPVSGTRSVLPSQLREQIGDLAGQGAGVRTAEIDDLLGKSELQVTRRLFEQRPTVLTVPAKLKGTPDLGHVPTDGATGILQLRDQLLHLPGITAPGGVPHVGVARDQPQRALAGGADPDRRVRLLDRLRVRNGVIEVVVTAVEVGTLLGPQRLDDLQRLAEPAHPVIQALDAVHGVLDFRPGSADAEFEAPAG